MYVYLFLTLYLSIFSHSFLPLFVNFALIDNLSLFTLTLFHIIQINPCKNQIMFISESIASLLWIVCPCYSWYWYLINNLKWQANISRPQFILSSALMQFWALNKCLSCGSGPAGSGCFGRIRIRSEHQGLTSP